MGRWTGLYDRNGKVICDGDRIRAVSKTTPGVVREGRVRWERDPFEMWVARCEGVGLIDLRDAWELEVLAPEDQAP